MAHTSSKPFGGALRELMDPGRMTYRELAEETRFVDGKGMKHAYITILVKGHDKPSVRAMELIARACGVQPDTSRSTASTPRCASSIRPKWD